MGERQYQYEQADCYCPSTSLCVQDTRFFLSAFPVNKSVDDSGKSKLPLVAAAASLLDTFKMPLREVYRRFTKSELFIMAWRSQEQYVEVVSGLHKPQEGKPLTVKVSFPTLKDGELVDETKEISLPEKMGPERDMSKLTSREAVPLLNKMGILAVPMV